LSSYDKQLLGMVLLKFAHLENQNHTKVKVWNSLVK
jgi:hypothetical protein